MLSKLSGGGFEILQQSYFLSIGLAGELGQTIFKVLGQPLQLLH